MTDVLDKYRLERRLGGGGMAEVFLASILGAEGFARRVAIKRVLPGFSQNDAFARMFIAEAKISSRLQHANIVQVLDFARDATNRLYLVMELVEGKDLAALVDTRLLPVPLVLFILAEMLRGLGHAHDLPVVIDDERFQRSVTMRYMKGVVHRDVSPHNVLLSWDGAVKVSDFGIAKARRADQATATDFVKGKPSYMSPEQANGAELDGRSDLFAVGIMLWEMLCGRRLFVGDDTRAILAAVMFRDIPSARSVRADVPKDIERVLSRLLERDLGRRYATAEEAIADIVACDAFPKNGREQLASVLRERFPSEAPVRHSMVRRTTDDAIPRELPEPSHALPTISVGAAPLRAPAPAPRRPPLAVMAGVALAVGVVVALVVVVVARRAARPAAPIDTVVVRPDAAVPDAPSAVAVQIDAALVVDAPALVDARDDDRQAATTDATAPSPRPPARVRRGTLAIRAFPALTVYIDRKRIHDTPVTRELPVGRHTLRLVNIDSGHDETLTITITEHQTTTIERL